MTGFRDGRLNEGSQGPLVLSDVHRHRKQGGASHVQVPLPAAAATTPARIPERDRLKFSGATVGFTLLLCVMAWVWGLFLLAALAVAAWQVLEREMVQYADSCVLDPGSWGAGCGASSS